MVMMWVGLVPMDAMTMCWFDAINDDRAGGLYDDVCDGDKAAMRFITNDVHT